MTVPTSAARGVAAGDWRAAVRAAARLLVEQGTAEERYVDACVETVEENGPYMVLAPGIALAHARPEGGGLALGLSAVTLAEPVEFGHPRNDPVDLVLAFVSPDNGSHVGLLSALARALTGGLADRLRAAGDDAALRAELTKVAG